MIVSHEHQYLYFAVPKTATHSIREVLRNTLGEKDWEQQTLRGKQYLPVKELAELGHGHISVGQAKAHLGSIVWNQYRRFAFVRNPFDRFVSACAFMTRGAPEFSAQPREWMKAALQRERFRNRVLIRPQSKQLCDENGDLQMHYVGRYENLQASLNSILESLGLPSTDLTRRNSSAHSAWQEYYDDELRQMLEHYYADDLRLFDYSFVREG